jgi:hypothetical protein
MIGAADQWRRRGPTAALNEVTAEPAPFPATTVDLPIESFFPDWRRRLARNLARRSDARWEPLTWVHAREDIVFPPRVAMPSRPFAEYRDTRLWAALDASISELIATREISVNTATDYVIGYICRELVAKKLIVAEETSP